MKSTVQCLPIVTICLLFTYLHTYSTIGNNWGSMSCSKTRQHVEKFGAQAAIFLISQYPEIRSCFRRSDPSILIFPKKYVKVENINWWSFDVCYNFAAGKPPPPRLWISLCVRVAIFNFAVLDLKSVECRNPRCSQILAAGDIFQLASVKTL